MASLRSGTGRYSGMLRCTQCRMFNRNKDQCLFCEYDPVASTATKLSEMSTRRVSHSVARMTPRVLSDICKDHGAPTCNLAVVQLHLNCVGFTAIDECISNYPEVESLWLERNKVEKIEHLDALKRLRCLGLNSNLIARVEGVAHMKHLTMLNLCGNRLTRLDGLKTLKSLSILLVADNQLRSREDIAHLAECPSVQELDLGGNLIDDVGAVEVLEQMPELRILVLERNPV
eukprot:CAMPEP_0197606866 /NCGR_PEP_ID=MMETSP1326-20131121/45943_1 /TAXON_ID=1155430 /ORGANISM="Genus nov. species nov., Strain RCC2288" /LENGTH=230 /DNA_ID=CAMNT_0043174855 /DNA_START=246 /DNA_END=935 /DNA_ORIENTATION=-